MPDKKRTKAYRVKIKRDHECRNGLQSYTRFEKGWEGPVTGAQFRELMAVDAAEDKTPAEKPAPTKPNNGEKA